MVRIFLLAALAAASAYQIPSGRTQRIRMAAVAPTPAAAELDWRPDGYETWTWKVDGGYEMPNGSPVPDINVGYIAAGDVNAPPVLLVHGFGASGFHWRRNIGALADAGYRVYAIDLLGFGATDKPVLEYKAELWRDECAAFLREVAGCGPSKRAVVAGNSIGGYTALALASTHPELVRGCASLNGAGKFAPPEGEEVAAEEEPGLVGRAVAALVATLQRAVITASFFVTKQPARIKQVLQQVYPVYPERADDILVASIQQPAQHPDAAEVFYRIVSRNGSGPPTYVDGLVDALEVPLLLLWGEQDPWIVSSTGDRLQALASSLGKAVERVSVDAGHCPQDEAPEAVNAALVEWMRRLPE